MARCDDAKNLFKKISKNSIGMTCNKKMYMYVLS